MKEVRFDPSTGISALQEVLISKAASRQRAGRSGRICAGHCWKMYSRDYFESSSFIDYPIPEICRVPLEEVVLQVLLLQLGSPESFLGRCLQPPSIEQIRASVSLLLEVNAILPQTGLPLTPLGYHLARIPMNVRLGKMLIMSTLLGVEEIILTVAASLCGKSPFLAPVDKLGEANAAHARLLIHPSLDNDKLYSDHLAIVTAFDRWREILRSSGRSAAFDYCRKNYLSSTAFEEMILLRENFRRHLISAGFLSKSSSAGKKSSTLAGDEEDDYDDDADSVVSNRDVAAAASLQPLRSYSSEELMLGLCSVCAGLSPNLARVSRYVDRGFESKRGKGRGRRDLLPARINQADGKEVFLHPSSKLCRHLSEVIDSTHSPNAFLMYHKKVTCLVCLLP
jgi:HrpA-like RNA helicase